MVKETAGRGRFSLIVWLLVLAGCGVAGYFAYGLIKRKMQEYALKRAIEKGCEDVARQFEAEQDEIAQDIADLIEKMGDLDISDLGDDLDDLQEELQEIQDDLVAKK